MAELTLGTNIIIVRDEDGVLHAVRFERGDREGYHAFLEGGMDRDTQKEREIPIEDISKYVFKVIREL